MSRRLFVTTVLIAAAVGTVSAQTGTADGVAALLRGNYQRAVEILKPIAEDWQIEDPAAQFFMAGIYDSGDGVPVDPLRACALYMRATNNYENPFGREASFLFGRSISRGQEFNDECQTLANIGFENGFEPRTFDLGLGHFVEWQLSAATVTYDGRTKRRQMPLPVSRGERFLPLQLTQLETGPTRALTRHFIEVFVWLPSGKAGPWKLQWQVFEVVRDEIITVEVSDSLTSADGDAPPPPESFDPREYALIRVNDDGDAELAVLKGPRHMTRRIETDAERREARETAAARDAELRAVDWKARREVSRQPTMNYSGAEGCGNIEMLRVVGRSCRSCGRGRRCFFTEPLDPDGDLRPLAGIGQYLRQCSCLRSGPAALRILYRCRKSERTRLCRTGDLAGCCGHHHHRVVVSAHSCAATGNHHVEQRHVEELGRRGRANYPTRKADGGRWRRLRVTAA